MEKKTYTVPGISVFCCETADSLLTETSTVVTDNSGGNSNKPANGGDGGSSELNDSKTYNFDLWDDEEDY